MSYEFNKNLHFMRRYNKIIRLWINFNNKEKSLEEVLKLATRVLFRYQEFYSEPEQLEHFFRFLENCSPCQAERYFSHAQFQSKNWLIEKLIEVGPQKINNTFILAGWIGLSAHFLLQQKSLEIEKIRCFDLDKFSCKQADLLNKKDVSLNWKFKSVQMDLNNINFSKPRYSLVNDELEEHSEELIPDLIINTSCEHLENNQWLDSISANTLLILQSSNDFTQPDHIRPSVSLDDFLQYAALRKISYAGELQLKTQKRFMIIGYK